MEPPLIFAVLDRGGDGVSFGRRSSHNFYFSFISQLKLAEILTCLCIPFNPNDVAPDYSRYARPAAHDFLWVSRVSL